MAGILYVVSTPIGNSDDLTVRALRVLREVEWIASEDPLRTKHLLAHYGIDTPVTTYHNLNKDEKTPVLIAKLLEGRNLALVSDGGTPVIFDPGYFLVSQAVTAGIRVAPIPGPSAPLAAAAASAIPIDAFVIHGFFPSRAEPKRQFLKALRKERRTLILLIQPGRLRRTLEALRPVLGTRRLALAKNLTMPDEEFFRGTVADLLHHADTPSVHDELTLVIEGVKQRGFRRRKDR